MPFACCGGIHTTIKLLRGVTGWHRLGGVPTGTHVVAWQRHLAESPQPGERLLRDATACPAGHTQGKRKQPQVEPLHGTPTRAKHKREFRTRLNCFGSSSSTHRSFLSYDEGVKVETFSSNMPMKRRNTKAAKHETFALVRVRAMIFGSFKNSGA